LPTGRDLVQRYLAPLAATPELAGRIRTGTRVVAVTRQGVDKTRTIGRDGRPYLVRVLTADGVTDIPAAAVIDASGTWGRPNPLGVAGLPAVGETESAPWLAGPLPDVLGRDRQRFAGRRVLVVGMGHSAANTLLAVRLQRQEPATRLRRCHAGRSTAAAAAQPTAAGGGRASLGPVDRPGPVTARRPRDAGRGSARRRPARHPACRWATGGAGHIHPAHPGAGVRWPDGTEEPVDVVLLATGYRPDLVYLADTGALDERGRPMHCQGVSTTVPGLGYVGLPGQTGFASATVRGVGPDARRVIRRLRRQLTDPLPRPVACRMPALAQP
jgi:hypothetical protein